MDKKKIYFAGKIKKKLEEENGDYFRDRRLELFDFGEPKNYYVDRVEQENFIYTGPKYYREHGFVSETSFDHVSCFYECKNAIAESDIVFVYLDDMDSYGTIAEMGFAYAMCKDVIVYYTDKVNEKEMWFVFGFANEVKKVEDHKDAREKAKVYIRGSLRTMPYDEYLQTDHWKKLSQLRKELDGGKCVLCSSKNKLNAHHRSYENRGLEGEINDLITVCNNCHKKFHNK